MSNTNKFKLSNQAIGALMMALQRSLLEQSDLVPQLQAWELANGPDGLVVENPPVLHSANIEDDTEESAVFNAWTDKIGGKAPWQNE